MPNIVVYIARADIGNCSGMVFSFDPIANIDRVADGTRICVSPRGHITVSTPAGYELLPVQNPNPNGDGNAQEQERMVLDADETQQSSSGRVYMRAARLIERMRSGDERFQQVESASN